MAVALSRLMRATEEVIESHPTTSLAGLDIPRISVIIRSDMVGTAQIDFLRSLSSRLGLGRRHTVTGTKIRGATQASDITPVSKSKWVERDASAGPETNERGRVNELNITFGPVGVSGRDTVICRKGGVTVTVDAVATQKHCFPAKRSRLIEADAAKIRWNVAGGV